MTRQQTPIRAAALLVLAFCSPTVGTTHAEQLGDRGRVLQALNESMTVPEAIDVGDVQPQTKSGRGVGFAEAGNVSGINRQSQPHRECRLGCDEAQIAHGDCLFEVGLFGRAPSRGILTKRVDDHVLGNAVSFVGDHQADDERLETLARRWCFGTGLVLGAAGMLAVLDLAPVVLRLIGG